MKILVLCGDFWHPAAVPRAGLGGLAGEAFQFEWAEEVRGWSQADLAGYPLAILAKGNKLTSAEDDGWMTPPIQAALVGYVQSGGGLLAIHGGAADYAQAKTLRGLLGGVFDHHPAQCPVTVVPRAGHPLTAGIDSPFTVVDEHYFMAMDDPDVEVFAITRSEHGEQPGAWRRTAGAGRVAVLTPGHNLEVWLHSSFQTLLRNALRWCGGQTE